MRNELIDNLRGFAIIVMILTHTTAFFPGDKIAYFLWNWSHFAVPIFIFCSAYLFLQKALHKPPSFLAYFKKRFMRLVVPYYIFLGFFLLCLLLISPKMLTAKYILQSLFIIGGVDINWMVLLFLFVTALLPFFVWSYKKSRIIFGLFFTAALTSTYWLLYYHSSVSYKLIMWLPWSLMFFFTLFYVQHQAKKRLLGLLLLTTSVIFICAYIIQSSLSHSLVLIHNKYPPNIFYLSYGMTIVLALTFLDKYIFKNALVLKILNFFSRHSYSIYFLHYTILTVLAAFIKTFHFNWTSFFLLVIGLTFSLQYSYNMYIKDFLLRYFSVAKRSIFRSSAHK